MAGEKSTEVKAQKGRAALELLFLLTTSLLDLLILAFKASWLPSPKPRSPEHKLPCTPQAGANRSNLQEVFLCQEEKNLSEE